MTWIFVMFMNGFKIDVDSFSTRQACEDKVRIYNAAAGQAGSAYLVWCEHRPRA
jgi:hypothetical protein